ncbi:PepSY domain-containing protein [Puteibacter caeruleilacunae]|nr:PepSY domain-containing protein [Puteibacter caeruleilacunae]
MSKGKRINKFRKFHKWPGIIITLLVILFCISGVIMNHRELFSRVDVNRELLPPGYQYNNWNLASVKSAVAYDNHLLVYGNIGVWQTDSLYSTFKDFNAGFPKGVDHRKVECLLKTSDEHLIAGTIMGLYSLGKDNDEWKPVDIPVEEERITDLMEHDGKIYVQTRSHLLKTENLQDFTIVDIPIPAGYTNEVSLFRTLWMLHSGEIWGTAGKILVDLLAILLIFLSISGILHWIFPGWLRRRKKRSKDINNLKGWRSWNLRWHNKIGYWSVAFLIFVTITGMFLRPPLLIAIASSTVGKIPYTELDSPNPWSDKLRRITYDHSTQRFLLYTYDGFYTMDEDCSELKVVDNQPPVSVMGCTVLEEVKSGGYLVGSFNGLFYWRPQDGIIINAFTGKPWVRPTRLGPPISDHLVSGFISYGDEGGIVFDYSQGAQKVGNGHMIPAVMPKEIVNNSPMSLWNVSLEVHTGRIFEHLLGKLYILYVPLMGLLILTVLISGFFIWWLGYRKS